jgi:sec-independent protein translocase protein TatA
MFANITGDWPYILIAVIVLFGGSQLPKLAKNAGEAMKEFKKAHEEATSTTSSINANQPMVTVPPAAQAAPAALPQASVAPTEERITLSRDELDAMLEARAKSARADSPQN